LRSGGDREPVSREFFYLRRGNWVVKRRRVGGGKEKLRKRKEKTYPAREGFVLVLV